MSKFAATLKDEFTRLGRKEANRATVKLKARVAALEKLARAQRQTMKVLARQVQVAVGRIERSAGRAVAPSSSTDGTRLSPGLIRALRKRLKVSQKDFARLAGVSPVAVYLWESGRTKPQTANRQAILSLRSLGVREVRTRLEELDQKAPARATRRRRKRSSKTAAKASRPKVRRTRR